MKEYGFSPFLIISRQTPHTERAIRRKTVNQSRYQDLTDKYFDRNAIGEPLVNCWNLRKLIFNFCLSCISKTSKLNNHGRVSIFLLLMEAYQNLATKNPLTDPRNYPFTHALSSSLITWGYLYRAFLKFMIWILK